MAAKIDEFPFDYEKTNLYEEFKLRAYRQRVVELQNRISQSVVDQAIEKELITAASNMQSVLNEVYIKRAAFFNEESVNRRFDLKGQLKKYGFFGKIISALLSRNY